MSLFGSHLQASCNNSLQVLMKMELGGENKRILSPVEPFFLVFFLSEVFMNLSKAMVIQGIHSEFK